MYGMDSKSGSTEMKLLRVDMGTERIQSEDVAEHYALLGGRGLIAALLLAELEPACDPQGPDNRLVICNGLLAGTLAASSGRISVGGKSRAGTGQAWFSRHCGVGRVGKAEGAGDRA